MRAPTPEQSEVERLYVEGQNRFESRDYAAAAESWTRLLDLLPESPENRAIRESVMINVLEAHLHAYRLLVDATGARDIEHLRRAEATLEAYYAAYRRAHGDRVAMSREVQDKGHELEQTLRAAEPEETPSPVPDIVNPPPPQPLPDHEPRTREGNGLIIGGSVVAALGLGALALVPVGSMRGRRADADDLAAVERLRVDPDDPQALADRRDANVAGRQANAMLVAGAVLAPVLIGTGAAMIGLGVRAKQRARAGAHDHALVPAVGPGFAGAVLRGRF